MNELKTILLTEDDPKDVELTIGVFWAMINEKPPME